MPATPTTGSKAGATAVSIAQEKSAQLEKLADENAELKQKLQQQEEKIKVMTESYAETKTENS